MGALARAVLAARLWLAVALAPASPAQTNLLSPANTAPKGPPENRYLLVVETSRSIHGRLDGTLRTIYGLVGSGMRGQMREGDTLAVWTFNDSLYTGQLGLQDCYKDERPETAKRVATFLQAQHYEKRGKLDDVVPALLRVVKASEFITVVLVTDGGHEIHGTPFDRQINESFKLWYGQQQDSKMPFVTVLRGTHGTLTHYSVAPIPWPVEFPPLPAELRVAKKPPGHLRPQGPKPAPRLAQPLIISGKKPTPAPPITQSETPVMPLAPPTAAVKSAEASATNSPIGEALPAATSIATSPLLAKSTGAVTDQPETAKNAGSPVQNVPANSQTEERTASSITPSDFQRGATSATSPPTSDPAPPSAAEVQPESLQPRSLESPAVPTSAQEPATSEGGGGTLVSGRFFNTALVVCVVLGCALAGILLWLKNRRPRPASHISLITRSLERNGP